MHMHNAKAMCVLRCQKSRTQRHTLPKTLAQLLALHSNSHMLNKQMAPEDKKLMTCITGALIILGTPPMTSRAAWSNGFVSVFTHASDTGHAEAIPHSVP